MDNSSLLLLETLLGCTSQPTPLGIFCVSTLCSRYPPMESICPLLGIFACLHVPVMAPLHSENSLSWFIVVSNRQDMQFLFSSHIDGIASGAALKGLRSLESIIRLVTAQDVWSSTSGLTRSMLGCSVYHTWLGYWNTSGHIMFGVFKPEVGLCGTYGLTSCPVPVVTNSRTPSLFNTLHASVPCIQAPVPS